MRDQHSIVVMMINSEECILACHDDAERREAEASAVQLSSRVREASEGSAVEKESTSVRASTRSCAGGLYFRPRDSSRRQSCRYRASLASLGARDLIPWRERSRHPTPALLSALTSFLRLVGTRRLVEGKEGFKLWVKIVL